jgi:hypothetical protein
MNTTTTDGKTAWKVSVEGGYVTNVRTVCACGRTCECAGDERCNRCQATAAAALKERVRLLVASGAKARKLNKRIHRASQKALLAR